MKKLAAGLVLVPVCALAAQERDEAVNIGNRLELFVDNYLVERMTGEARMQLQHPVCARSC